MQLVKPLPKRSSRLTLWEWPAYLIDIYRVFPRGIFLVATYLIVRMGWWYMYTLTSDERTGEVSAFIAVSVAAWTKLADWYMQRGVDWHELLNTKEEKPDAVSIDYSATIP